MTKVVYSTIDRRGFLTSPKEIAEASCLGKVVGAVVSDRLNKGLELHKVGTAFTCLPAGRRLSRNKGER